MLRVLRIIAAAMVMTAVIARPAPAEIIDRILAVVSGQIITKSDLDTAITFGIVDGKAQDPLQALIDRFLMLSEVRRIAPPPPPAATVDKRLADIRARFASSAAVGDALTSSGINEQVLRIFAEDDVMLAAYLQERFSSAAQLSDQEVLQVGEANRQKLADERRQGLINGWLTELRRRADISILE